MTGPDVLKIGFDLGARFTKVAWLLEGSPKTDIKFVNQWLTRIEQNANRYEVPSKIHYNEDTGRVTWGYNIPVGCIPISWLKLLLVEQDDLPDHLRDAQSIKNSREKIHGLGKTPVEVVGDYLGQVFEHSMEIIEAREGTERVRAAPIILMFATPPEWKAYAKEGLRLAAQHGGLLNRPGVNAAVQFLSDPWAALASTIPIMTGLSPFQEGDTIVVIDAGCSTMNIFTFEFPSQEPNPASPLLRRTSSLRGGSVLADEGFEYLLKKTLGSKIWGSLSLSDIGIMMNTQWEHNIKRKFDGSPKSWVVDLPDRASMGQLSLKSHQICSLFDGTISHLLTTYKSHFKEILRITNKAPKIVVLVGGLIQTPYVTKRIKKTIGNFQMENPNMTILVDVQRGKGDHPVTAVSRGLVWDALRRYNVLQKPLNTRTSRYRYILVAETILSRKPTQAWEPFEHTVELIPQGHSVQYSPTVQTNIMCRWPGEMTGAQKIRIRILATRSEDQNKKVDVALLFVDTPAPLWKGVWEILQNGPGYHEHEFKVKAVVSKEGLDITIFSPDIKELARKRVPIAFE
ncbi:hypothetical protein M434DRAFT_29447 [Hypoxylon sp. CO27-5]|nr:hypothetical protein M434DRAFT_29447 [Hypoxylon sp. CO27-5]